MGLTERHLFENEDVPENYEWALEDAVYNSRANKKPEDSALMRKCISRKYKMPELLCCPFCGQDAEMHYLKYDRLYDSLGPMYWVSCPNCFAEIKNVSTTEKEAKDAWNRREGRRSGMEIVNRKPVPVYETVCPECKSNIRYKACEVSLCHITCPVCGVSIWANTINPAACELSEKEGDEV